jgi:uncharacterized protein YjeT (DUF2065 family)
MSPRTLFLSRLLGLFCLLFGLAMLVHEQAFADAMTRFTSDAAATLCLSLVTVVAGLAMVLAHNVWTKPPAAIIVTVVGWLTLLKGLLYLLLPATWQGVAQAALHSALYLNSVAAVMVLLGAYLTFEGFRANPAKEPV